MKVKSRSRCEVDKKTGCPIQNSRLGNQSEKRRKVASEGGHQSHSMLQCATWPSNSMPSQKTQTKLIECN